MGFKQSPFPMVSGTSGHASALKKASAAKKTDWEAMQKKSAKADPRYGKMSAEDYKKEALRQSKSKASGKGWDAMGVYDTKGKKKKNIEETKKKDIKTDPSTEQLEKSTEQPEISKGAMIGNILAASLTGGLDAVYGTGKVLPPGTKLEYTADKGKKQKTTSDIEKDIEEKIKI